MADQIAIRIPRSDWREGSAFTASVNFRTRSSSAASTPTTIKYRVDCLTTGREVLDWTEITPAAASASIAVTGAYNAILDDANDAEVKQLTVMADDGLATQHRESARWRVENLYGSP
jgi:hypothetical protein